MVLVDFQGVLDGLGSGLYGGVGVQPQLSICIPTMGRARVLDAVLDSLAAAIEGRGVEICVSDNASLDDSVDVLEAWRDRLPGLRFTRQDVRVDYATNIGAVAGMATANHVWLVPDYAHVSRETVDLILEVLQDVSVDAVFMNISGRVPLHSNMRFESAQEAFRLFGWHATMLGSFVLHREAYAEVDRLFSGSDFIHFEACFSDLAARSSPQIVWLAQDAWAADPAKKIAWGNKALTLWMSGWRKACLSLPEAYPLVDRIRVVKDHHRLSGVFEFPTLCSFRLRGGGSLRELLALQDCWRDTGLLRVFRMFFVAVLPLFVIRSSLALRNSLK